MKNFYNPLIGMDYPDPDLIRVGDTWYMISTTMHFMPGGEILRSYNLTDWERVGYVFDDLDHTPAQCMENGENIYGQGMWAASLRYHNGIFYVCFAANDTHRTYLYQSENIEGPWKKQYIEGFYHDCSLLFDDDRVYIVYGNTQIYITELTADLSRPKPGGLHRKIIEDTGNVRLGYEGAHAYKINGKYYVFLIHWPNGGAGRRTEACFVSDSLESEFIGRDILDDDRGYFNCGVAQGGIVDTPEGEWYAFLFQDSGATGRIPILVPVDFTHGFPEFGSNGEIVEPILLRDRKPEYVYEPLTANDKFQYKKEGGKISIHKAWQWNHVPDYRLVDCDENGGLKLTAGSLCQDLCEARNTLTQRMIWPGCRASVVIDGSDLNNGDYAGICALQGCYGMIAITREADQYYLVMRAGSPADDSRYPVIQKGENLEEHERVKMDCPIAHLELSADFSDMKDIVVFRYWSHGEWKRLGSVHKLYFKLDHFTGCRVGLFCYASEQTGGTAVFHDFTLQNLCIDNRYQP